MALDRIVEERAMKKISWAPVSQLAFLCKSSPYVKPPHGVSGIMLNNHTAINVVFDRLLKPEILDMQFPSTELDELQSHIETVKSVSAEYKSAALPTYLTNHDGSHLLE